MRETKVSVHHPISVGKPDTFEKEDNECRPFRSGQPRSIRPRVLNTMRRFRSGEPAAVERKVAILSSIGHKRQRTTKEQGMMANMSETEWVEIRFRPTLYHDAMVIVRQLIELCKEMTIAYTLGSLSVQVNKSQLEALVNRFGDTFVFNKARRQCVITENDWQAYSEDIFLAALADGEDRQSSRDFHEQFCELFVLTATSKTFSILRPNFEKIKLFCVRFAYKIEELSGLQVVVPKLSLEKTRADNNAEMMRAFISIYSAYSWHCTGMGNHNRFCWDYTIDTEE